MIPSLSQKYQNLKEIIKQNNFFNLNYHIQQNFRQKISVFASRIQTMLVSKVDRLILTQINNFKERKKYDIQQRYQQQQQKQRQMSQLIDKKLVIDIKIHVILEAIFTSHYYYSNYFELLQVAISNINKKKNQTYKKSKPQQIEKGQKPLNNHPQSQKNGNSKFNCQWHNINIDIITCTNYHAIFGVLYTLMVPLDTISKKMSVLSQKFKKNENVQKLYGSKQWMTTSINRIRVALEQSWQQKYDVQNYHEELSKSQNQSQSEKKDQNQNGQQDQNLMKKHTQQLHKLQFSAYEVNSAFEKMLDYVSGSYNQLNQLSKEKRKKRFEQLFSSKNAKSQNVLKRIQQGLLDYFGQFLFQVCSVVASGLPGVDLSKQQFTPQIIFKGMVVDSLITAIDYKKEIFSILVQQKLDPNITLKNFHDTSPSKILINFNCINTTNKRFELINMKTRPNMPLWAALMASASLPYLQGKFSSRDTWEQPAVYGSYQQRQAAEYFRNQQAQGNKKGNKYVSANFLTTLPITFMTNQKIIKRDLIVQQQIHQDNFIQIVFNFEHSQDNLDSLHQKNHNQQKNGNNQSGMKEADQFLQQPSSLFILYSQINNKNDKKISQVRIIQNQKDKQKHQNISEDRKIIKLKTNQNDQKVNQARIILKKIANSIKGKARFINCGDVLKYFCQWLCCCCCFTEFGSITNQLIGPLKNADILQMLMLRIDAHDNLILSLYKNQLIKLPLRIGTLDFHLINKAKPDLQDTIKQARQVTREMFDTVLYQKIKRKYPPYIFQDILKWEHQMLQHRVVSIEFSGFPLEKEKKQRKIRVKFISYSKWRKLEYIYKVKICYPFDPISQQKNKTKWKQLNHDYFDIEIQEKQRKLSHLNFGVQFRFVSQKMKIQKTVQQIELPMLQSFFIQDQNFRVYVDFPYQKIISEYFKLDAINEANEQDANKLAFILTRFLQKHEAFQLREEENEKPRYIPLQKCLNEGWQAKFCKQWGQKNILVAMISQSDVQKQNYCLKCKLSNFIVKQRSVEAYSSQLILKVPHKNYQQYDKKSNKKSSKFIQKKIKQDKQKYPQIVRSNTPIENKINRKIQRTCMLCKSFANKLWHQQGINWEYKICTKQESQQHNKNKQNKTNIRRYTDDEYNGIFICQACCLNINQTQA